MIERWQAAAGGGVRHEQPTLRSGLGQRRALKRTQNLTPGIGGLGVFLHGLRPACLWLAVSCVLAACPQESKPSPSKPSAGPASPGLASLGLALGAPLHFKRADGTKRTLKLREMLSEGLPADVDLYDPVYRRKKRYRGLPLIPVLQAGLGLDERALKKAVIVVQSNDGYQTKVTGEALYAGKPFLAVGDRDYPDWEPIPRHGGALPSPYYLVWAHGQGRHTKRFPWPWQIVLFKVTSGGLYDQTAPPQGAPEAARLGHKVFLRDCIGCHGINRQGGRLGPDLNAPRNILEYRAEGQLRAFIKNPRSFRFSRMPAQSQLKEAEFDQLMAYFKAVGARKMVSPIKGQGPAR